MKQRLLYAFAFCALLAGGGAVGAVSVWNRLQAPRLDVPARIEDVTLPNMIVVQPGVDRAADQSVRIAGNTIAAIGEKSSDAGALLNAYEGMYLLPGLIDMHVHYPPKVAAGNAELWSLLFLAHGVTTVRETGSIDGSIFAVRERIRGGETPGPRIFAAGAMIDGDPASFPSNTRVTTPEAARAAVRLQYERGADAIKVYNMLDPVAVAAIVEEATARGLPIIGHVPHAVPLAESGITDVQHMTGFPVSSDETIAERQDFSIEDWQAMDNERLARLTQVCLEHGKSVTPNLVNSRKRRHLWDTTGKETDTALPHLPAFWDPLWRALWTAPFANGDDAAHVAWRSQLLDTTKHLHDAGVPLHAGTDVLMPFVAPGSSLHGELEELVAVGLTVDEAWQAAGTVPSQYLGQPKLGWIRPGAPADLLIFREDPTQDLASLRTLEAVIADGRLYTRAYLDAALATYDAHFHSDFYSGVMGVVVNRIQGDYKPDIDEAA